ncbi:uncharacterized protein LOC134534219 [Bacillus rossius redtenbacheri]|uniref:uncharacterized protein LOC134534219 n=1 Tax=Bacillus rossius redtenbacheri TaxID=93214 RepID=UPI002FDDC7D6
MEDRELCVKKLVEQEYETQLFGFSSQAMIDAVRTAVSNSVEAASASLARKISEHMDCRPEDARAAAALLVEECETAVNETLPAHEGAIAKHFRIPSHVLLEEDEPQRKQVTPAEAAALDDRLADLTRRAKRAALLDCYLDAQLEAVAETRRRLEACEARLGSEQAALDLRRQAAALAESARAFTDKAGVLGRAELLRARQEESVAVLRRRFQHLN